MRDQRRADEDHKHTSTHSYRKEPERRRQTSPASRREAGPDRDERQRVREIPAGSSYRSTRPRADSRDDTTANKSRRVPHSPERDSKSKFRDLQRARPLGENTKRPAQKDHFSSAPPSKRRRSRSPSPHHSQHHHSTKRGERFDHDRFDRAERGGRRPNRDFSPRRESSPIHRSDRHKEPPITDTYIPSQRRRSRSPVRRDDRRGRTPPRRSRSPPPRRGGYRDRGSRPSSPHITYSRPSKASPPPSKSSRKDHKMQSQPIQSIMDDPNRPPSPVRPIPTFGDGGPSPMDADNRAHDAFSMHGMRPQDQFQNRPGRPHVDTRQSPYGASPQYMTPNSSYQGSPQSGSPFPGNRGGWSGPPQQQFHGQQG